MRKSVIDIGTNTILMLIAEFDTDTGTVKTILDEQRIPRLGKNVDENRNILPSSFEKAITILNEYKQLSKEYNSESITATATSFIRDANNKPEFIQEVKNKTGIEIEILSGDDEAKWTFRGGVYDKLKNADNNLRTSLIDIGGGSTEIITSEINNSESLDKLFSNKITGKSLDIGAVRIKEKFMNSIPSSKAEIDAAKKNISETLEQINFGVANSNLIGVAGTVTTLGAMKLGLSEFSSNKVDGLVLSVEDIVSILNSISGRPLEELESMGDYMIGRADILIPGILILKCFMDKFNFREITVSTKGLRYGIFLREVFQIV